MNDKALISRVIVDRDQHAFATLVRMYQQPIRQFLCRLTAGDHALADDIAQDVFLTAYNKLVSYRGEASFSTWLHSIAYRGFLNEKRKSHYTNELTLVDNVPESSVTAAYERELLVEKLMLQLSIEERTCITLAYSAGMSHREIVAVTQLPLGTVKSHIKRGKTKLAEFVQHGQENIRSSL